MSSGEFINLPKSDIRISLYTFPEGGYPDDHCRMSVAPEAVTYIELDEDPGKVIMFFVSDVERRWVGKTRKHAEQVFDELRTFVNMARTGEIPMVIPDDTPEHSDAVKAAQEALLKALRT